MNTFSEQKQQVVRLLDAAAGLARRRETREVEELFEESARRLSRGELFVVVCGEFKKGKSSLLNALLDEPSLFPVDIDITTSLVTTISYAPTERIQVWFRDERRDPSLVIERGQIADYVSEQRNRGNHRRARLLSIQTPKPQLKDGLVLVDTPGVGGLNSEHSDVSYAFIPNADVIIFVTDALAPISPDELAFVKERVAADQREVLYVMTKIDRERDYEMVLDRNRSALAETLGRSPESIRIMPVSSHNRLQYLKTGDEEDLADSRFPEFEAELWRLLNEGRGRILTLRGLSELGRGLNQLRNPVVAAMEACQAGNQKDLDRIEQQLEAASERLQQLLEEGATWRVRLDHGLIDLKKDLLNHDFEDGASSVRKKFNGYLRDARYLNRPIAAAEAVRADVSAFSSRLFKTMLERCEALQGELENSTAISLSAQHAGPLTISLGQPDLSGGPARREGVWRKVLGIGRQATFNGSSGVLIGASVGALIGGAATLFVGGVGAVWGAQVGGLIGSAIGSVAGVSSGVRKGLEEINTQEQEEALRVLRSTVGPFLDDALRVCRTELDKSFTGMERAMSAEFVGKLSQEKKALERSLKAFQETRQLTHAQASERLRALRESLREIDALLNEGERLASSILPAGGPAGRSGAEQGTADYGDFADV